MVMPPAHDGAGQRLCDSCLSIVRTGFLMACGGVVLSRMTGTVSVVVTTVDEAAGLEAEAEEYPDERGEILLEAAEAWRRAGRSDRARELLARLIREGGDDGCSARFTLARATSKTAGLTRRTPSWSGWLATRR